MLVIGIAGGSGSGKTTVVKAITEKLKAEKVVVIPQDSYYKDSSDLTDEEKRVYNFDHPNAIDWELLCRQLSELKHGKTIKQPVYSYISCTRSKTETVTVEPADVIIIEGILIFTCKQLREQMDVKIFVDADDDDRLMRVMARDISERGTHRWRSLTGSPWRSCWAQRISMSGVTGTGTHLKTSTASTELTKNATTLQRRMRSTSLT